PRWSTQVQTTPPEERGASQQGRRVRTQVVVVSAIVVLTPVSARGRVHWRWEVSPQLGIAIRGEPYNWSARLALHDLDLLGSKLRTVRRQCGPRGSRENSHLGTRSMACMPLPIVAAPVLVAHSRSNTAPDELDNIQAFRTALRLFSDQELSSMLTQALRRQAIFREQEKVLMHRAEGDLVQWIGS